MKRLILILSLALVLAHPAHTQTQDDRSYLQALLEDNLSGAGREVRIKGFEGALSSRATIEELTIADAGGVWLTLKGAVLDWNRAALLRGRLDITELSAQEILLPRLPSSAPAPDAQGVALPSLPSPEATAFALPDLPVSINIASLSIAKVVLGKALFGEAATVSLKGKIALDGGTGSADLGIVRTDGTRGEMTLSAAYSNATRNLGLSFKLSEAAGGIAANLIGLPDRPSVDLAVSGNAPLDRFAADISLDTNGVRNLQGQVILGTAPTAENQQGNPARLFQADLGGDLRPLVLPQYRDFLGSDLRLTLRGAQSDEGLRIDTLSLTADALHLTGNLRLGPDYWPARIALNADIAAKDGGAVLLSIPGPETRIDSAELTINYDAARGQEWTAALRLARLRRDGMALDNLRINGAGTLQQGDGALIGQLRGKIDLAANGIAPQNRDLALAIGPSLAGLLRFDWQEDAPFSLSEMALTGDGYSLSGDARIAGLQTGLNLTTTGTIQLQADQLARFSSLAGQDLAGQANLKITGTTRPLDGTFDLRLTGTARDLGLGIPQLDPIIAGDSTLILAARRDETGTEISQLQLRTSGAALDASGTLKTGDSSARFDLRLVDAALALPGLNGAATASGTARQTGTDWAIKTAITAPGDANAALDATVKIDNNLIGAVTGTASLSAADLTPYAALTGYRIGGALHLNADGQADLQSLTFAGKLQGKGRDLRIGMAQVDGLLRGDSSLAIATRRDANGVIVFDQLEMRTPLVIADLTGSVSAQKSRLRYNLDLRDIGYFAAGFSGPVAAQGVVSSTGGDWTIASDLTGPGGTSAIVKGSVAADATHANLAVSGSAPLALANSFIAPNLASGPVTFDLALNGPLAVTSLTGTIRTDSGNLVVPGQRIALSSIAATAQIASGQAQIQATSSVSTGGTLVLNGALALGAPFQADLTATLANLGITEPGIYATTADGQVSIRGPLTQAPAIRGALTLGPVEIRVPETTGSTAGPVKDLVHTNEPAAVHQTRLRAGLIGTSGGQGSSAAYPLDISVAAPSRIFVRGRGLDAELGGQLTLQGTTANVVTAGRFDLIRGRLDLLGKRLALTEGSVQLQGDFNPYLRIVAETESSGTTIRIVIQGLASAPQITFESSPELPEDEVLALLLFGRDLAKISPLQALRIASAINTLAGSGGEGIVGRLRNNFGLDDLDVTTDEAGATGVRAGKYISENIYTDVTVDSTGKSEIDLNLSLTPALTARGRIDSEGKSGIGLFYEKDY